MVTGVRTRVLMRTKKAQNLDSIAEINAKRREMAGWTKHIEKHQYQTLNDVAHQPGRLPVLAAAKQSAVAEEGGKLVAANVNGPM
jgi:hypothetical protein